MEKDLVNGSDFSYGFLELSVRQIGIDAAQGP
jgi:hypothetical protein